MKMPTQHAAAIRDFILLPVNSAATAKAYIDALAKNDCVYHPDDDPKEIPCFSHDEALIVADRMESVLDYLETPDPYSYCMIATARQVWAAKSDAAKTAAFATFDPSNTDLSDADMVALLEWKDPSGHFETLEGAALYAFMEHYAGPTPTSKPTTSSKGGRYEGCFDSPEAFATHLYRTSGLDFASYVNKRGVFDAAGYAVDCDIKHDGAYEFLTRTDGKIDVWYVG